MTLFCMTGHRAGHKECDSINKVECEREALKMTWIFHDGEESRELKKKKKKPNKMKATLLILQPLVREHRMRGVITEAPPPLSLHLSLSLLFCEDGETQDQATAAESLRPKWGTDGQRLKMDGGER